ncbi:GNAT family N-acetyltransferase [Candidatus Parcubacteria bacterium]|nr:GNAT family N-acetyltransferase [Candidatus Parcubacteria bacterium]
MKFDIRPLHRNDLTSESGFFETLGNLRSVGDLSPSELEEIFGDIEGNRQHAIYVADHNGRIIGAITLLVERKFIRQGCRIARIEDVATHRDFQKQGVATKLLSYAQNMGTHYRCLRAQLACLQNLVPFYEQFGFEVHGVEMRKDLCS